MVEPQHSLVLAEAAAENIFQQGFTFAGYEAAVERLSMRVNDDHAIVSTPIMGPVFLPAKTQFANIFKTAPEVKTDIAASRK